MRVPLQITFRNTPHSVGVEEHVRRRVDKLCTFAPRITACRVAIELPHRHGHHGNRFRVRIDLAVPRGELVVERAPDAAHVYEDAYGAVDAAFTDAARRLREFSRKKAREPIHRARRGAERV